jgi:hypothetical protein
MTITQLIQTSPMKANELFSKLADTSDGAIKTREKLFAELKDELETLASLEEKHLFPVLRKHPETKGLVADAVNDNKQVRKLLSDLDRISKADPEFAPKLTELRKVFQSHVRDEKKELLPAVRKALSSEEAQAVVEKIEAGRAEAEREKKAEPTDKGEPKSAGGASENSARVISHAPGKMTEAAAGTAKAPLDVTNEVAQTTASTTKKAAEAAAGATKQVTESAVEVAGQVTEATARTAKKALRVVDAGAGAAKSAGEAAIEGARQMTEVGVHQAETVVLAAGDTTRAASWAVQPALHGLTALSEIPVASLTMVSDVGQVWSDLVKENLETGARVSQEIFQLRNPQEIAVVQSRFAVEVLQSWLSAGTRMMHISLRASDTLRSAAQRADGEGKNAASAGS